MLVVPCPLLPMRRRSSARPSTATVGCMKKRSALGFARLEPRTLELELLHDYLDTWHGIGDVITGMARQDFDLQSDPGTTAAAGGRRSIRAGWRTPPRARSGWACKPMPWAGCSGRPLGAWRRGCRSIQSRRFKRRMSAARPGAGFRVSRVRRREFLLGAGALLSVPLADAPVVRAQNLTKMPTLGLLYPNPTSGPGSAFFFENAKESRLVRG